MVKIYCRINRYSAGDLAQRLVNLNWKFSKSLSKTFARTAAKSRRVGGSTYQVPSVEVRPVRRNALGNALDRRSVSL